MVIIMNKDKLLVMFTEREELGFGLINSIFNRGILQYLIPTYKKSLQEALFEAAYDVLSDCSNVVVSSVLARYNLDALMEGWMQDFIDDKFNLGFASETLKMLRTTLEMYLVDKPATESYVDNVMNKIAEDLTGDEYPSMSAFTQSLESYIMTHHMRLYNDINVATASYDAKLNCIAQGVAAKGTVKINVSDRAIRAKAKLLNGRHA